MTRLLVCDTHGQSVANPHHALKHCPGCAQDMATRVAAGETLKAVGKHYRLTRERIRQIVESIDPQATRLGQAVRHEVRRVRAEVEREQRRAARPPNWGNPPHGTTTRYKNHGCRCQQCRAANSAAALRWRQRQTTVPPHIPHGLHAYSNYGCRCETCRAAGSIRNREYKAQLRAKHKQQIGVGEAGAPSHATPVPAGDQDAAGGLATPPQSRRASR